MHIFRMPVGSSEVTVGVSCPDEARKRHGLLSWSLQPLQTGRDVGENYFLASGLKAALRQMNVREAYAPHVKAASARVVQADLLKKRIRIGNGISIYREQCIQADGVFLDLTAAFVMSASGCPVVIASNGKYVVVAHAGRDSLIDRGAVMGKPTRDRLSVVDSIIDALLAQKNRKCVSMDNINICMLFAIPMDVFEHREDHPCHGEYNQRLGAYAYARWPDSVVRRGKGVFLNLEAVFVEQARQRGVLHAWATHSLADFPALAHTHDGKDPGRRNLIVVKRNA